MLFILTVRILLSGMIYSKLYTRMALYKLKEDIDFHLIQDISLIHLSSIYI